MQIPLSLVLVPMSGRVYTPIYSVPITVTRVVRLSQADLSACVEALPRLTTSCAHVARRVTST